MRKKIKQFVSHPLISGSTIIFLGSFFVNVLSWGFNLLIGGRGLISASDYGLYTSLMSLTVLFGVFSSALIGIFAKFAAQYTARQDGHAFTALIKTGFRLTCIIGAFIIIILTLGIFSLLSFLHINDARLLLLTFLVIASTIFSSLPLGVLQGQMRFYSITFLNILSIVLKIIFVVALVLFGWKIFGVMIGVFLASVVFSAISFIFIARYLYDKTEGNFNKQIFYSELKKYSSHFFLSTLGTTLFTNSDLLLVRHFFPPVVSGQYAALSVMGKAIFYFIAPIFFVFFPLIAHKKEKGEKYINTLLLAGVIVIFICGFLSSLYFVFPTIVLRIFFPAKAYVTLVNYLGLYSMYVVVFAVVTLMNNFLLSVGKTQVYILNLIAAVCCIVLIFLFHANLYQVIAVLLSVAAFLLTSFIFYALKS